MAEDWAKAAARRLAALPPEQQCALVAEAVEASVGDLLMRYCPDPIPAGPEAGEMAAFIRMRIRERLAGVRAELGSWG